MSGVWRHDHSASADDELDWRLTPVVVPVLGDTEVALYGRATRGKVLYMALDQRRWCRVNLVSGSPCS